jgi:hypothetical protein
VSHVNARLTVPGRRLIVDRVATGRPVVHIAAELGVSRQTAYRTGGSDGSAPRRGRSDGPLKPAEVITHPDEFRT